MLEKSRHQAAVREVRRQDRADALSYPTRWHLLRRALSLLQSRSGQHGTSTRQAATSALGVGGWCNRDGGARRCPSERWRAWQGFGSGLLSKFGSGSIWLSDPLDR